MIPGAEQAAILAALEDGPCVCVTVVAVKGSAPRAPGAAMVVGAAGQSGSIGGGRLEFAAQKTARDMLAMIEPRARFTEVQGLGPDHEQCCGGMVTLSFQRFETEERASLEATPSSPSPQRVDLYLFGAGHVGTALVPLLAELPVRLHWFDPRPERLPATPPAHVAETQSDDPVMLVESAPDDALFLVMTHSHPLDEDICFAVLERDRFGWLGLIGSKSKRARFAHRLARRGIDPALLERLQCPVGLAAIQGKRPATIALAIAAQLAAEHLPEALR